MPGKFWLDSDVLMRAKNEHYAFDIAPGFWEIIKRNAKSGKLCCPSSVLDEIARGGDELSDWVNAERGTNLFVEPDQDIQRRYTKIAEFVRKKYSDAQAAFFLTGADGWLIASALSNKGIVVTHEVLVGPESKRVKIPNVCREYGVEFLNCFEMLRKLGESLHDR
jgi:hypothetical protein